jgi:diguanylate cyclase (GGDEF)-like protein
MDAINVFQSMLKEEKAEIEDVYSILVNVIKHIFDVNTSGVVGFDEDLNNWIVKDSISTDDSKPLTRAAIDIDNSAVCRCITSAATTVISPIKDNTVRVSQHEDSLNGGIFVAVPLTTRFSTYGALYFENKQLLNISQFDLNILEVIASHAAHTIEKLHVISMLNNNSLVDPTTGILNPPAFYTRLEEEVKRYKDFEIPLVMCLFQLDKYASYSPNEHSDRREKIIFHVLNIFRKKIKDYDLIARADENVYSVVMIGVGLEEAQLWAQKIRQEIASTMIEMDGQQFSVTVSIGLAAIDKSDTLETFLANSRRVLDKSIQKTNTITKNSPSK